MLIDGEAFFPTILRCIHTAQHYVLMEMYLFESGVVADRFIDAFLNAAKNGVHVLLLLDGFGALKLASEDLQKLRDADVQIAFFNPLRFGKMRRNLFRDHRKLILVDGIVAFTGGAGITDSFHPTDPSDTRHWRETMIKIQGPCVTDWQNLFMQNWKRWVSRLPLEVALSFDGSRKAILGTATTEGGMGRVVCSRAGTSSDIVRSLIQHMRSAKDRIWLASAYFVPSWKIRRTLRHCAKRGIDVRLLLPGQQTDHPGVRQMGRRHYERLLHSGVRIFEYQPRFLHAKVFLCDQWVSIGSSNLDGWNFRWNLEANQEIQNSAFSLRVYQQFLKDFQSSEEISRHSWKGRSWHQRLTEWFWGKIVTLLVWMSREIKQHRKKK